MDTIQDKPVKPSIIHITASVHE